MVSKKNRKTAKPKSALAMMYPSGCMGMFFYEKLNYEILISNSSTILAMVQLPSSIASNSNMTIYMGFKSD